MILLILYYCLERFTYYSIGMYLPIYFATKLGLSETSSDLYYNLTRYLPFLSLILAAILIDRVSILRNLKLYFIPIVLGILFCMLGTYPTIIIGTSIFVLSSSLIQINIFLKIFKSLKNKNAIDDRVFLILYLALNLFSALAPILTGTLRTKMSIVSAYSLPNIVLWILFGILFIWRYSDEEDNSEPESIKFALSSKTLKVIAAIFLGFLIYHQINTQFFHIQSNFKDHQDYNFKLELIPSITFFVIGISFLFLAKVQHFSKIIIALISIATIGVAILFIPFSAENIDIFTIINNSLKSGVEIIIYPAVITLILLNSHIKQRGTNLAVFFILLYSIKYINLGLKHIDSILIIVISELILFGLIYLTIRFKRLAAHNTP